MSKDKMSFYKKKINDSRYTKGKTKWAATIYWGVPAASVII